jgi:hypothetical protein
MAHTVCATLPASENAQASQASHTSLIPRRYSVVCPRARKLVIFLDPVLVLLLNRLFGHEVAIRNCVTRSNLYLGQRGHVVVVRSVLLPDSFYICMMSHP